MRSDGRLTPTSLVGPRIWKEPSPCTSIAPAWPVGSASLPAPSLLSQPASPSPAPPPQLVPVRPRSPTTPSPSTARAATTASPCASRPRDRTTCRSTSATTATAEFTFDRSTFSTIEISLRSGNDSIRIDQINGTFADETIDVDGGSGNDSWTVATAPKCSIGGSGNDAVDGNSGDDTAYLGSGTDTFRWDPGDDNDLIEGESGTDTLDFNGAGAAGE